MGGTTKNRSMRRQGPVSKPRTPYEDIVDATFLRAIGRFLKNVYASSLRESSLHRSCNRITHLDVEQMCLDYQDKVWQDLQLKNGVLAG